VCWGSWPGPHTTDVPLKDVADLILKVRAGAYLIEGANPRHEHEWRVWEKVKLPHGKTLVPGVISHATNIVEHPELVAERLVRIGKLIGRENLMGGTDCGFAQGPFHRRVAPVDHVGEAGSAGRRSAARKPRTFLTHFPGGALCRTMSTRPSSSPGRRPRAWRTPSPTQ